MSDTPAHQTETLRRRRCPVRDGAPRRHREFDASFIWASVLIAVPGGFGLGAWLVWRIGTGGDLPGDFPVWVQVHGHLQLIGWVGLFIIGVSLFFVPRLAGVPLNRGNRVSWILWLFVAGLLLQTIGRLGESHAASFAASILLRTAALGGAILEWCGTVLYLFTVARTILRSPNRNSPSVRQVRPYFAMAFTAWLVFATLRVWLMATALQSGSMAIAGAWNQWAVEWFIHLVLLPLTLAFSIRNLPHFLHRAPVNAPVRLCGWAYLVVAGTLLAALSPPALGALAPALDVAAVARLARDGIVLWLVWEMNVFFRARPLPHSIAERDKAYPGSPGLPWKTGWGRREWGRPEWLILAAYFWLVTALWLDGAAALGQLFGWRLALGADWVRHLILLGFVTLLILGMAHKMIPGFLHKPRLACPGLPPWIFLFANAAVVTRFVPQVAAWFPSLTTPALRGFAISGVFGMIAVALLGWNLWQTKNIRSPEPKT